MNAAPDSGHQRLDAVPRISVVITCYNLGSYLHEALDSIARYPTPQDYEVIIVDDGSTDPGTVKVVDGLDHQRYRVIRQRNQGLAMARNNGVAMARAPYIIILDADNRIHPVFMEQGIAIMDAHPEVGVVYGDAMYFEGRTGRRTVGRFDLRRMIRENYIDACACLRKSVLERAGGYDPHMPVMGWEDWDLWLRLSVAGVQFHYVPEVLFDYRVRDGSMISGIKQHIPALQAYIFDKPELRFLRELREEYVRMKLQRSKEPTNRELLGTLWHRFKRSILPRA